MTQSYPAQIVFIEADRGGYWSGRLLNQRACVDTQKHNRPAAGECFYNIKEGHDGRFYATFQGRDRHGRRYRTFDTLNEAQKHAIRWAGQRFRILVEVPR